VLLLTEKGKEGTIDTGLCFNVDCHKQKVADYRSVAETNQPEKQGGNGASAAPVTPSKRAEAKVSTPSMPKKLQEYAESLHFQAAAAEVPADPHLIRVISLLALIKEVQSIPKDLEQVARDVGVYKHIKSGVTDARAMLMTKLLEKNDEELDKLLTGFSAALVGNSHGSYANDSYIGLSRAVIRSHDNPLPRYFVMNEKYLSLLTISGIRAVLEEAGFDKWMEKEKGEKAFSGFLKGKKKGELVEAIMDAGFDWVGFVPAQLSIF
jgi:hypothetical protein